MGLPWDGVTAQRHVAGRVHVAMPLHRAVAVVVGLLVLAAGVARMANRGTGGGAARQGSAASGPAPRSDGFGAESDSSPSASARVGAMALPRPRAVLGGGGSALDHDHAELRAAAELAEVRWKDAEATPTPETWELAADAHARAIAACGAGPACAEHAYAECLARANAVRLDEQDVPPGDDPVPLPPRLEAMVDAMDRYVALAPDSDDAPGMRFLAARAKWRHRHFDDDTFRRLQVMAYASPPVEVTEYAINLLLDAYLRSGRSDELHREVTRLLADRARLARFPDLIDRLNELERASRSR